jgi:hypothetical protein
MTLIKLLPHTALPWNAHARGYIESVAAPARPITVALINADTLSRDDARYLETACNSHEVLVTALHRLLNCPALNEECQEDEDIAAVRAACAALTLAGTPYSL